MSRQAEGDGVKVDIQEAVLDVVAETASWVESAIPEH